MDEKLSKVAVIGAGGKMGSGIALLLLQEMTRIELLKTGKLGSGDYRIELIDQSEAGLNGLYHYLKVQMRRHAEQHIQRLREVWKGDLTLISNSDIIDAYVDGALGLAKFSTEFSAAKDSLLIFEAISEDFGAKVALYKHLESINEHSPFYFTNTSSIPIHILANKSDIQGRLLGFHFYNPPAVQMLLELIVPSGCEDSVKSMGETLARRLHKIVVHSNDIAGFIGNGQFIREILYSLNQVRLLSESAPLSKAIAFYDQMTRELLVRPMGMFQLIDYVGLDVVMQITKIMAHFLPDASFTVPLIDQLLEKGIRGGQHPDGSQKDGFFIYKKGRPDQVYALETGEYQSLPELFSWIEPYPYGWKPWKEMQKDKQLDKSLETYFDGLLSAETEGAFAATEFIKHSRAISAKLVEDGVAASLKDVGTVLKQGFFHLYGPDFLVEK